MGFGAFGSRRHGDGLKRVIDLAALTSFSLRARHTNTIFLCGEAALAVALPAAAGLPDGWTVRFVGHHVTSGTLTNTVTITGAGTNELIGHTVTGGDNQNRQLQPATAGVKDNVKLHSIAAGGDWVEITKIGSNFFVYGDSRITNALPMA